LNEHLTRIVASCEPWGQSNEVERLLEVATENGPPTKDPATDKAYDGLGATYDSYWEVFRRNFIEDRGMPLDGYVHYGRRFNNAFWDGQRMVFGDGDERLLDRLRRPRRWASQAGVRRSGGWHVGRHLR
jgi:Zn-dependent metalloprotease